MLIPAPRSPDQAPTWPKVSLVVVLACALAFGWILTLQAEGRPRVDAAVERLERAMVASPEGRLSPAELVGMPDRWKVELTSVTDANGPMDPEMSAAVSELRARVHELPSWRFGWIPSMKSSYGWLTYIFVHTHWTHLLMNLLLLWILGATLETRGSPRLLGVVFMASGAAGAWAHAGLFGASTVPLLGSSAAVAGVLGGLLVAAPSRTLSFLVSGTRSVRPEGARIEVPVVAILLLWIGLEWVSFLESSAAPRALAAHLSGLLTGALVAAAWRRMGSSRSQGA